MRPPIVMSFAVVVALGAAGLAHAAEVAAGSPPDDMDALSLADKTPAADDKKKPAAPLRMYVEGAFGEARSLGADDRHPTTRASFDLRYDGTLAPGLRAVVSDHFDRVRNSAALRDGNVNTLREAYLSWSRSDAEIVDVGRVNIRHGAAIGFNPTDWFKENALRSIVSPDPYALRENRQGTFVLQGQKLWDRASVSALVSPKLGDGPNPAAFALDAGATNPRNRWLLAGSYTLSDRLNPELLVYGGAGTPVQAGGNVSFLLGESTVVFGEAAFGRGRRLVAEALQIDAPKRQQQRVALGATYTTGFNLSLTAEAEYNSAAPDRAAWQSLAALGPYAQLQVLSTAQRVQELPFRRAVFVYATWKDALLRRLDLSAYLRRDAQTDSRDQWLEARYRWDRADLALQWQAYSGIAGSVYASVPQRRAIELVLRAYL
jgi:hypothetical protein